MKKICRKNCMKNLGSEKKKKEGYGEPSRIPLKTSLKQSPPGDYTNVLNTLVVKNKGRPVTTKPLFRFSRFCELSPLAFRRSPQPFVTKDLIFLKEKREIFFAFFRNAFHLLGEGISYIPKFPTTNLATLANHKNKQPEGDCMSLLSTHNLKEIACHY
jgi:hypothetical protein